MTRLVDVSERLKRFITALINKGLTGDQVRVAAVNTNYTSNHDGEDVVYIKIFIRGEAFPDLEEGSHIRRMVNLFLEEQKETGYAYIDFASVGDL